MPGQKTLFRKVQVVLEYAKEGKHTDIESLVEYIESNKPTNFLTSWRNKETDIITHCYSTNSIRRTIKICMDLQLFQGATMELTRRGRSATDSRRFPTIIGNSVKESLELAGISFNSILQSISAILHTDKPHPPTSESIWEEIAEDSGTMGKKEFQSLLTLLGQCQILSMSQKRIFLPKFGVR
jgi:hypothetical protein